MYMRLGFNLVNLVCEIIGLFELFIIIRAVLSWVSSPFSGASRFFTAATEPVIAPVRRVLSGLIGNWQIDISPAVTILLLDILKRLIHALL